MSSCQQCRIQFLSPLSPCSQLSHRCRPTQPPYPAAPRAPQNPTGRVVGAPTDVRAASGAPQGVGQGLPEAARAARRRCVNPGRGAPPRGAHRARRLPRPPGPHAPRRIAPPPPRRPATRTAAPRPFPARPPRCTPLPLSPVRPALRKSPRRRPRTAIPRPCLDRHLSQTMLFKALVVLVSSPSHRLREALHPRPRWLTATSPPASTPLRVRAEDAPERLRCPSLPARPTMRPMHATRLVVVLLIATCGTADSGLASNAISFFISLSIRTDALDPLQLPAPCLQPTPAKCPAPTPPLPDL